MKKSLLIALFAAMPLMAQEAPQKPECAPQRPCCKRMMNFPKLTDEQKAEMKAKFEARRAEMLAKFDADKDGKLSDEERKAAREARRAEMKAKFMEKFDTDKDGKISDAEKEAIKAEFQKRGPKGPRFHGQRGGKRHGFGPKGPRGFRPQLSDEQKAEMKAKFMEKFDTDKDGKISDAEKEAIKAEFQKRGPKGPRGFRPQLSEEQKAEMKAKREARRAEMLAKFDADKDGKLSDEERKAAREARRAEMKAKFMEKFDTDKDGKISDAEKEAIKAEFQKRGPKGPRFHGQRGGKRHGFGPKGPRPCCPKN